MADAMFSVLARVLLVTFSWHPIILLQHISIYSWASYVQVTPYCLLLARLLPWALSMCGLFSLFSSLQPSLGML